ncbi:MAG: response regulator [Anaerolineae bacterium]|nr:response regulator [Anaerolineae bacterium]
MSKKILIIDDDDLVRNLIRFYLEHGQYRAITAGSGSAGIDLYQTEQPDLIILDIAMPEMSGFEVATCIRRIEREEQRPYTPIVLLTAYARSFFLSASSESGIDSYLTKPISPEQLLHHIDGFLGERAAPRR